MPARSFAAPGRRVGESWAQYHDRLAAMALEAKRRGAKRVAAALEARAGLVASKHVLVRTKARTKPEGPGTYPWAECIKDARTRGAKDPAAVCGAIRARSAKRYPAYWKARRRARNPSGPRAAAEAKTTMAAAVSSVAEALKAKGAKARMEWFVSASMYSGQALVYAEASGDRKLATEASSVATHVRHLIVESSGWKPNPKLNPKPKARKTKNKHPKRDSAAVMRQFMSYR